ncbi:MAG: hypothetical protein VXW32_05235 [Myxococcota bacterium]|nr:hypothetical protein [Myxococcota bacterium]
MPFFPSPCSPLPTSGFICLVAVLSGCGSEAFEDSAVDTEPATHPSDFMRVNEDAATLEDWGYTIEEWQLSPEASAPYDSLFPNETDDSGNPIDYRPTFFALKPTGAEALPKHLLVWIHGGGVADDREFPETGELPEPCTPEKITGLVKGPINKRSTAVMAAVDAGWGVLFPRNDWCDAWLGQGENAPYMPEKFGNHHLHRVLDFASDGGLGTPPPEFRYLWGSSAGGNGAIVLAAGREDISGMIVDSAPTDWVAYHSEDPELVESHFGGPPFEPDGTESDHLEDYLMASGPHLVDSGLLPQRIFVAWNTHDRLIQPVHGTELVAALEDSPSHNLTRFGHKDFNRRYPDPNFHVQVSHPEFFPAATSQVAMQDFLLGNTLTWLEAETACSTPCSVGVLVEPDNTRPESERALSNQSGRMGLANGTSGILAEWSWTSPTLLEGPQRFRFAAAFETTTELEPGDLVGTMHIITSKGTSTKEVLAGDLHFSLQNKPRVMLDHIAATTIEAEVPNDEEILVQWEHSGRTRTLLDHVIVSSPNGAP